MDKGDSEKRRDAKQDYLGKKFMQRVKGLRASIRGKINKLENCVLGPVEPGSTKLDVTSLPEPEQKLFEKCLAIRDNFDRISDYVPTETERRIMETAVNRLTSRVIDLFTAHMKNFFGCDKDDHKSLLFKLRF